MKERVKEEKNEWLRFQLIVLTVSAFTVSVIILFFKNTL